MPSIAHHCRAAAARLHLLGPLALLFGLLTAHAKAQTYSYDGVGRLTQVVYPGNIVAKYTYDDLGNLTSKSVSLGSSGGGSGGGGCWIATAAYGSALDPHVEVLREFRDRHLLSNAPGRMLVRIYEATSPPIAAFLAGHDSLRFATRCVLAPVVLGASHPQAAALAMFAGCALVLRCLRASAARRRTTPSPTTAIRAT